MKNPLYCSHDTAEGYRHYYRLTHRIRVNGKYYYTGAQIDVRGKKIDDAVLWSVPHFNRSVRGGNTVVLSEKFFGGEEKASEIRHTLEFQQT